MKSLYDHEEKQYLSIIKDICDTGDIICGRNGMTLSKNGASMYFDLRDNSGTTSSWLNTSSCCVWLVLCCCLVRTI